MKSRMTQLVTFGSVRVTHNPSWAEVVATRHYQTRHYQTGVKLARPNAAKISIPRQIILDFSVHQAKFI
jgi:hypothetical protein